MGAINLNIIEQEDFDKETAATWYAVYKHFVDRKFQSVPLQRLCKATASNAHRLMWLGGVRSLKTSGMMQLCGWHATGVYPSNFEGYKFNRPTNILIIAQNFEQSLKKIVLNYLLNTVDERYRDLWVLFDTVGKSGVPGMFSLIGLPHFSQDGLCDGRSEIHFRSWQEGASAFQGFNAIDMIFIDEEPPFDVYLECCRRLTEMNNRRTFLFISMWPAKGRTELIRQFMDGREKEVVSDGFYYQQSGWADNPFMSEEAKADLRRNQPSWMLPAVEYGRPIFGVGKVFEFDTADIIYPTSTVPRFWKLIGGLDPAATYNGTWGACVLAVDYDSGCVYVIKEYLRNNLTFAEHGENLRRLFNYNFPIICDPAGGGEDTETRLSAMKWLKDRLGFNIIPAEKVNKAKEKAVAQVYDLKRSDNFKVFDSCVKYIEEFSAYSRDDSGRIVKENDHILDASFYALAKLSLAQDINTLHYRNSCIARGWY